MMVELGLLWDTIVSSNSLPTGLGASALKPPQHSWLSDPFKPDLLSCHSLLETPPRLLRFPQNESQGPGRDPSLPLPLPSLPALLHPRTSPGRSSITRSTSPLGVGRGYLCICPLVRRLLLWISVRPRPSLLWGFCSNITLLVRPSLIILYKLATPTSSFSRHSLSYLLCLNFLHSIYHCLATCYLALPPGI